MLSKLFFFSICSVGEDSETELTQLEQESFVIVENVKKDERKPRSPKMMPSNENMAKLAQTISSFSLRKRKGTSSIDVCGSSILKQYLFLRSWCLSKYPSKITCPTSEEKLRL